MNLSKRLKVIADLVDTEKIVDVGCDHGYLDIYLTLNKSCKCIASDISKKAIQNCIDNINTYNLTDKIRVIVTNGLDNINIEDDTTIIISGMGTNTIIDILSGKILSNNLIISSNNNLEDLRRFVVKQGYYIADEVYVEEHGIHYVIIKFKKGKKIYNDYEYLLGSIVSKDKNYMKYILYYYQNILDKIPIDHYDLRNYYQKIINYIKKD